MKKKYSFFLRNKLTVLQSNDIAIVDIEIGTISITRGCEIIYISVSPNEKDHKIYIGALRGRRPAMIVREITGFNVSEETNGGNSFLFKLTSKYTE